MNKKQLPPKVRISPQAFELMDGNIPGIYNYCDRWCERCRFTEWCSVYEPEDDRNLGPQSMDDTLKTVAENLGEAIQMLYELAEEQEIDLDNIDDVELPQRPKDHPLLVQSKAYGIKLHKWLSVNRPKNMEAARQLAIIDEEKAKLFLDAWEVAAWYSGQIFVKFSRAMTRYRDDEDDDFDNQASAKVALIGTERSLATIGILLQHLPDSEDELLELLVLLELTRKLALEMFPRAMEVVRPGLDEYAL